jgi:hypothetical protein
MAIFDRKKFRYNGILKKTFELYDRVKGCRVPLSSTKAMRCKNEKEFSKVILCIPMAKKIKLAQSHIADKIRTKLFGIQFDKDNRITFETDTKLKIVISKNPIDFLFATTGQPYDSCYTFGTIEDLLVSSDKKQLSKHNIYICFATLGEKRIDIPSEIDGSQTKYAEPMEHFIYQGRAWLYTNEMGDRCYVGRPYGNYGYFLRDAIGRISPSGLTTGFTFSQELYDNVSDHVIVKDKYEYIWDNKDIQPTSIFNEI